MTTKDIRELLDKVEKSLGCFVSTGDDKETILEKIPSDIPLLDRILDGGFPRGRIHILRGEFSTGKTFIAQKVIEAAQKREGIVVHIDAERRYDPEWFARTGVDVKNLIVVRPDFGEQAIDVVLKFLAEEVDLIVIDSLAALTPVEETHESMEHNFMALQGRMFSKACRLIVPANKRTVILATNQLRASIGNRFNPGMADSMPGGNALGFYASTIIDVKRRGWLKEDGKESDDKETNSRAKRFGFVMECYLSKCNYAPPQQFCQIPFNFQTAQLDNILSVVNLAVDEKVIEKSGPAWYLWHGEKFQGLLKLRDKFTDEKAFSELKKEMNLH